MGGTPSRPDRFVIQNRAMPSADSSPRDPSGLDPTELDPAELDKVLAMVSEEVLGGRPVPPDLAALWAAQLSGDTDLLDAFELVLLDSMSADEAMASFADDPDADLGAIEALASVVSSIGFVAEALDGALLGYWFAVPSAPVVLFDANGQLELLAATLSEALVALADPDDDEEVAEVVEGLVALGAPPVGKNHAEVLARVEGIAQPNEAVLSALLDVRLRMAE